MRKIVLWCLLFNFTLLSGCGTIFYPERRGNATKLDPGVAILDGIGLLFFILPGVIAYAVDFTTGCIYLSSKRGGSSLTEVVPIDTTKDVNPQIDQIIATHYGLMADNAVAVNGVVGMNNWYQFQRLNASLVPVQVMP